MPRSSSVGVSGEYVHHTTGVRMRLNGEGELKLSLHSLDNVRSYTMLPLQMNPAPGIEPTRISNFKSQRTSLEIKTTEINEWFTISRILVFMKPSATSLPG